MLEKKNMQRIHQMITISSWDNKDMKPIRLIDYPVKGNLHDVDAWYATLKDQTKKTVELLKQVTIPTAQIEDQNLLNYLEFLLGENMTEFPRPQVEDKKQ